MMTGLCSPSFLHLAFVEHLPYAEPGTEDWDYRCLKTQPCSQGAYGPLRETGRWGWESCEEQGDVPPHQAEL